MSLCTGSEQAGDSPPGGTGGRDCGQKEEGGAGERATGDQEERESAAYADRVGKPGGGNDAGGEAEEEIADCDEIGGVAVVAPGGEDGTEESKQKARQEKSGEGLAALGRSTARMLFRDVHCL